MCKSPQVTSAALSWPPRRVRRRRQTHTTPEVLCARPRGTAAERRPKLDHRHATATLLRSGQHHPKETHPMANTPEHGLNVPLDDDEQRRLAAEAERAGLTPQQYAHDTLMQAVNDRLILAPVRPTAA